MGLFKKHAKATASIRFDSKAKATIDPRQWRSDDNVKGTAYFRLPVDVQDVHFMIRLSGMVSTRTNETPPGSLQPKSAEARLKFLSVGLDSLGRSDARDGVVEVPFGFDLTACQRYSTLESALPPSLDSKSEARSNTSFHNHDSSCASDITYTITASSFSASGPIVSTSERILILPVSQQEPPSYGSLNVPGEYFVAKAEKTRLKLTTSMRTDSTIAVAGQEPSPIILRPGAREANPSTNIQFMMKLHPQDCNAPPELPKQVHVKTQLITKTRISPNCTMTKERRHATDQDFRTRSTKSSTQQCTLAIPKWDTHRPDGDTPEFAIARPSFLYRLPYTERPSPTFSTPLLAREYALEVKVSFPDDAARALKLCLPVEIVYESDAGGDDALGEGTKRKDSALSCVCEVAEIT